MAKPKKEVAQVEESKAAPVESPVEAVPEVKVEKAPVKVSGTQIVSTRLKSQTVHMAGCKIEFDANGRAVVGEVELKAITPFMQSFQITVIK